MDEPGLQYPGEALRGWLRQFAKTPLAEPTLKLLVVLADTVFFASLGREEGEATRVRIAYHAQGLQGLQAVRETVYIGGQKGKRQAWETLPLEAKSSITDFSVEALVKLAPAANLPRMAVVVGPREGKLRIQGLARRVEYTEFHAEGEEDVFILHAPEPGHLVVSTQGREVFRYEQGAPVPPGRRVALHDLLFHEDSAVRAALMEMCATLVESLPKVQPLMGGNREWYVSNAVQGLIRRMAGLHHGGLIAFLPKQHDVERIRARGKYVLPPEQGSLLRQRLQRFVQARADLINGAWQAEAGKAAEEEEDPELKKAAAEHDDKVTESDFQALVESIGQFTAVDNALVLGPELEVLCAGYQIALPRSGPPQVFEARTLQGRPGPHYPIHQHGSRHRAAAVFANQHSGAIVFVASQDGPLRCLHRPPGKKKVLLWSLLLTED
ncbi:hypothetical protein EJ065_1549 [Corallococcus coralloides]|uniref:Probable sensor domain-containing protein n=1 Tax=Corallococcus coralloides TaxID=184914 RepID=A0A410RMK3_CORCK|nr:hypothetical protein [Corallococcus coralloides]QAT83149.1 hypothetical protein EJ065_1549 [Corallococcus coralloides]